MIITPQKLIKPMLFFYYDREVQIFFSLTYLGDHILQMVSNVFKALQKTKS